MPVSFNDPFTIAYHAIETARRFIKQMEDAADKNPPAEGSDDLDAYSLLEIACALEIQSDTLASFGYLLRHSVRVTNGGVDAQLEALKSHVQRNAGNQRGMEETVAALQIAIDVLDELTDQLDAEEQDTIEDEHAVAMGALWTLHMAQSFLGACLIPGDDVEVVADEPELVRRGA